MDYEKPDRDYITRQLTNDFYVFEKMKGYHRNNEETVFYDLVLKPKQEHIDKGFDDGYFVIEVKRFMKSDKVKHDTKLKDLLWQCIVYSYSDIIISEQQSEKPLFVLYYIGGDGIEDIYKNDLMNYHHFVQRGGVGRIDLGTRYGWNIVFGGTTYYNQKYGKGKSHVGTKRMVGSSR